MLPRNVIDALPAVIADVALYIARRIVPSARHDGIAASGDEGDGGSGGDDDGKVAHAAVVSDVS